MEMIAGIVVVVCILMLFINYKINGYSKLLEKVPPEVKRELSQKPSFRKLDERDREQYKSSSWKYGLGLYVCLIIGIVIISIAAATPELIPMLLLWTSPIGLVIALLVFRDMARVSPKKQLYVVKAYCAYRIYGRTASAVLVYYNFITAQYEAAHMSMTSSASKKNVTAGSFVEALVTQKEDKLKLIDVV